MRPCCLHPLGAPTTPCPTLSAHAEPKSQGHCRKLHHETKSRMMDISAMGPKDLIKYSSRKTLLVLYTVSSFNTHGTNTIPILLLALTESDVSPPLTISHNVSNTCSLCMIERFPVACDIKLRECLGYAAFQPTFPSLPSSPVCTCYTLK